MEDHPDLTLIFNYVYENEKYGVTIRGKQVKIEDSIQWYGPLWLYCTYGTIREESTAPTGTYVVKSGDTLSKIARNLHVTVKHLANLNQIKNPDRIRAGQTLKY